MSLDERQQLPSQHALLQAYLTLNKSVLKKCAQLSSPSQHALQQASIVGHIIDMGLVPGLSVSGVQGQQQNVQGQQSQAVKNQQQSQAEQNQQQAQGQQQTVSGIQGQQHNQSQLQQQGGCVSLVELGAGKVSEGQDRSRVLACLSCE